MSNDDNQSDDFIPSATFQGAKAGYYFGTGSNGTGYYLDQLQQEQGKKRKRSVKIAEDQNETKFIPSLLEQAEKKAEGDTVLELTPKGIQSATNALSKISQQNSMQRARFPNEPRQYMNSELALYEQLTALQAVAANVNLYQHLLENKTLISTLTDLLGHENLDISAATVGLFLEWIDPSLLSDEENSSFLPVMKTLASEVLREAWEVIASNISKYDVARNQNDDSGDQDQSFDGVQNSLSLMENLMDLDLMFPNGLLGGESEGKRSLSVAAFMVKHSNIVAWLFQQLDSKEPSIELKARSIEILSLLSQKEDVFTVLSDWSRIPLVTTDAEPTTKKSNLQPQNTIIQGIEILLQAIGKHRKKQPETELELEVLENSCGM